jgi:hypothetical protein
MRKTRALYCGLMLCVLLVTSGATACNESTTAPCLDTGAICSMKTTVAPEGAGPRTIGALSTVDNVVAVAKVGISRSVSSLFVRM